jgi:hypothetical protein
MKILFVSGEADYAASLFEENYNLEDFKDMKDGEEKEIEIEGDIVDLEVLQFGAVDPKFIEFISDRIQDYDHSKHFNYYILEE